MNKVVGNKIKELRLKLNYSALKLAKEAGIAQSYLSDIENGKSVPTIDKLSKILKIFNISLSEFFSSIEGESEIEPLTDDLKYLVNNAKSLTPEQLKQLNEFLRTLR